MNLASLAADIVPSLPVPPLNSQFPRTQKARGIAALARFYTGDLVLHSKFIQRRPCALTN